MGIAHYPSIVLDKLILYYDAANSKSYSGSGVIINNLSENSNYNARIRGSRVTFSASQKAFEYTGTSDSTNSLSLIHIYRNGELIKTNSRNLRNPMGDGTARPFAIGSNVEGTVQNNNCFIGKIAIVRIYGKALSAVEIKQNYLAHKGRFGL